MSKRLEKTTIIWLIFKQPGDNELNFLYSANQEHRYFLRNSENDFENFKPLDFMNSDIKTFNLNKKLSENEDDGNEQKEEIKHLSPLNETPSYPYKLRERKMQNSNSKN